MASNRPGEMRLEMEARESIRRAFQWPQIGRVRCDYSHTVGPDGTVGFQWPQIGRVRCDKLPPLPGQKPSSFNGLKSAG